MKILIALMVTVLSIHAFAEVSALNCRVNQSNLIEPTNSNSTFTVPFDAGARKITYMVSETTADRMATYNTTLNIFAKADESGLKILSAKAWPDGGAKVLRTGALSVAFSFPSRLDKHSVETTISCEKISSDYFLVSHFSFKDDDYLNVPGLAVASLFELADVEGPIGYAHALANVKSFSEYAAKEFCVVGDVSQLYADLKKSAILQSYNDDKATRYPNFWERSTFNNKTLAPQSLKMSENLKEISWSQPRENEICTSSHHETVNDPDTNMDQDVEVCDTWAPQKLAELFNQIKNCNF